MSKKQEIVFHSNHSSLITFCMKTTRVLLIRHGQSEGNAAGRFGGHTATPLSARGRKQAEATAQALRCGKNHCNLFVGFVSRSRDGDAAGALDRSGR